LVQEQLDLVELLLRDGGTLQARLARAGRQVRARPQDAGVTDVLRPGIEANQLREGLWPRLG